jgi:purine-binding chemotaxis protein CheW
MTREFDWEGARAQLAAAERMIETTHEPTPEYVAQIYHQRSLKLAQAPPSLSAKPDEPVLVFQVAGERYSVPLDQVAEVIPLQALTPVPGLPKHIAGVINVRGEIRPVISLRVLLGRETPAEPARGYVLLLSGHQRTLGLQVDSVEGMASLVREQAVRVETSRYISCRTQSAGMLLAIDEVVRVFEGEL